jgi:glycerol-3-phosphate acyltransferase PlsY
VHFFLVIIILLVAFLLGSFPSGVVIGRLCFHKDIRDGGSGNIGTTNAFRVLGNRGGAVVFLCDFCKGVLAVALMRFTLSVFGVFGPADPAQVGLAFPLSPSLPLVLAAALAVLGHMFSPWIGFRGGKGIATAVGAMFLVVPLVTLLCVVVFVVLVLIFRYVSLASIMAAVALAVLTPLLHPGAWVYIIVCGLMGVLIVIAHRKNIARLLRHEEPRFAFHH